VLENGPDVRQEAPRRLGPRIPDGADDTQDFLHPDRVDRGRRQRGKRVPFERGQPPPRLFRARGFEPAPMHLERGLPERGDFEGRPAPGNLEGLAAVGPGPKRRRLAADQGERPGGQRAEIQALLLTADPGLENPGARARSADLQKQAVPVGVETRRQRQQVDTVQLFELPFDSSGRSSVHLTASVRLARVSGTVIESQRKYVPGTRA
jgi:hypothetical protein